jgi:hypothetical protein
MNFETFHKMMQGAAETNEASSEASKDAGSENKREPIENGEVAALVWGLCAENCVCW